MKKRLSHRARKVYKEAKDKYGRDYGKIKAKLMTKLALTDTHKSNCREALRRGLHKKDTENLKQFGSRIYEVCLGAYPDDKSIEETAIDHFLIFIENPILASQLQTSYNKRKDSFEDILLRAIEAENILRSHTRQHGTKSSNFPLVYNSQQRNDFRKDFNHRVQPITSSSHSQKNPISPKPQYDSKPRYEYVQKSTPQPSSTPDLSHIICFNCNERGHYATNCTKPKITRPNNPLQKLTLTGPNNIPVKKLQENSVKKFGEHVRTPRTSRRSGDRPPENRISSKVEENPLEVFCNDGEENDAATFYNLTCVRHGESLQNCEK